MNIILLLRLYSSLTIFLFLISVQGWTQSTESGGSIVIPPSPNAASLINQSSEKVQLYTGSLNVQLPIFDLKSRRLNHQISLSYNGSGNRVNELASWVGLGWALNAGGVVTRVVRGIPDEYDGNMYLPSTNSTSVPAKGFLHPDVRGGSGKDLYDYFFFSGTTNTQRKQLIEYSNKTGDYVSLGGDPKVWDTEPDEFHFNFGMYSGKFVFDKDGQIQIIPHQNLKISKVITDKTIIGTNSRQITSFEIVDPDGVKYSFGNSSVTSAASLTAVETTNYSQFTQRVLCGRYGGYDAANGRYSWSFIPYLIFEGSNNVESIIGNYTTNYQTFTSTWHLIKIKSPNDDDEISFNYVSDGDIKFIVSQDQDMDQPNLELFSASGGYLYGSVYSPSNGINESGSTTGIKGGSTQRHQPQNISLTTTFNTIKAKRLSEISCSEGTRIQFIGTIDRVDLYGGKVLNEIRIIDAQGVQLKKYTLDFVYTSALNQTTSTNLMDLIDAHVFYFPYLLSNGSVDWFSVYETSFGTQDWADNWSNMVYADHHRLYLTSLTESTSNELVKKFELKYNFDEVLPRRMSYKQDWWGYYNNNTAGHLIPRRNYTDILSQQPEFFFKWVQGGYIDGNNFYRRDPDYLRASRSVDLTRTKVGALKEIIYPTGGKKEFIYSLNKAGNTYSAGGLRVSEIRSYPDVNSSYFESTFYSFKNGNFARNVNQLVHLFQLTNTFYDRATVNLSSSSATESYLTKGGVIGYSTVEETKPLLGKTTYHFVNPDQIANTRENVYDDQKVLWANYYGYPFNPQNNNDHIRGNLDWTENYDAGGKKLNRVTNTYSVNPEGFIPKTTYGFKPGKRIWEGFPLYYAGFYKYTSDWVVLTGSITENYNQGNPGVEAEKIVTSIQYSYVPISPTGQTQVTSDLLPRKITQTLPNGEKLIEETKFPRDYSTTGTETDVPARGLHLLKFKNIESVPIESITYSERNENSVITKTLLGGNIFTFKEFFTNKVYPFENKKYKPGSGTVFTNYPWSSISSNVFTFQSLQYKNQLTYGAYDRFGNPTSTTGEDGLPMAYTWYSGSSLLTSATRNPGTYQHQNVYAHKLLVGLSNITDPNGQDLKFNYDGFNRLKLGRDHQNNILARYIYNYKNDRSNEISFTYSTYSSAPLSNTIQFQTQGSGETGSSFLWDFGDGSIKENGLSTELKSYSAPGNYIVKLATKHPEYPTAVTSKTIRILPVPNAQITSPTTGTNRTVCGVSPTTCTVTIGDGPYNYQWESQYTANGTSDWQTFGTNSNTAVYNFVGVQSSSSTIRCKVSDPAGNSRYSNYITIFHYCSGSPGGGGQDDCPSGWTWNAQLGRCDPPPGHCDEGCFWNGRNCICL